MKIFNLLHKLLFCMTFICVCTLSAFADVSCPAGYVAVNEGAVYVSVSGSCPTGHTQLGGEYGGDSIINCIDGLANGNAVCTFFDTACQSGKYFDGTSFQTCSPGTYCDGTGTATPGASGCSGTCPENSTSASGASYCTCNTGYTINGVVGGAVATTTTPCIPISCGAGNYLNGDTCEICPAGSYCANNIKTECDAGYTTDATGASERTQCYTSCTVDCTQPTTCPENAKCAYGSETATGTQNWGSTCNAAAPTCSMAITCNAGYWLNGNTCEICPVGSYCADNTKTECDAGYTTDATGASERTQCYTSCTVDCTQPTTCPENATCEYGNETATGTQNWGGACNAVAPTCSMTITCNAGYWLNGDTCEICPAGSYCANNIKTECDAGYTTDATGASERTQCYTSCTVDCTQPTTCPENATCAYGSETATGTQNWGSTCNAAAPTCSMNITCNAGYNYNGGTTTTTNACVPNIYTVAYDCNGGSGDTTGTVTYGETFAPNMGVCARNGYTLAGYTIDDANVDDEFIWNYTADKTLVAVWTPDKYSCSAGYYLDGTGCEKCPAGKYCVGVSDIEYDGKIYGLTPCPTAYPSSAPGATSDTQCYTACTMSNTDFANSASVTGKDYYGDGYDTCTVATCDAHYHRRPDLTDDQVITLVAQMNGMNPDEITDQDREMILSEMEYAFNNWDAFFGSLDATYQQQITTLIDSVQQHNHMPTTNAMWPFVELYRDWNAVYESTGEYSIPSDGFAYAKHYDGTESCGIVDGIGWFIVFLPDGSETIDCDVAASQNAELAVFRQTAEPGDWLLTLPTYGITTTGKSKCDYDYDVACRATYTSINGIARPEIWGSGSDMAENPGVYECKVSCDTDTVFWNSLSIIPFCAAYFAGEFVPDDANEADRLEQDCSYFVDLWAADSGAYISYVCDADTVDIPAGQYLPAGTMTPIECPANSYCAGQDDAIYDAINDQGITPCPVGTVSAPGATAKTQCASYVKLHIGEDVVMNLVSARPTTSPVMVFQVGDTPYYAPMSATETPINSDTTAKYRVLYNETEYWVHDYTAQ